MPLLNIVLVEPEIPQNTGNVVRTCAATGARLHLVGPMGFRIDDKKLKRAGLDYWRLLDIVLYESLSDFFAKNSGNFFYFTSKARRPHASVSYPRGCYLVFGKGDGRPAGGAAGGPPGVVRAHPHDPRFPRALPEPFEQRGRRCV